MRRRLLAAALSGLGILAAACATPGPGGGARFVPGPAGRLKVVVAPGRPGTPVLFVHGLGGDTGAWAPVMARLGAVRTLVAFDARGHGDSDRAPPGAYSVDAWTEDLEAVLRELGLPRAVLVGHSLAGCVLQRFAARHPERVAALVYADAIGDFRRAGTAEEVEGFARRQEAPTTLAQRQAGFQELLGEHATPGTRAAVLRSLEALDGPAWSGLRAGMGRFVPPGRPAPVPTLAIEAAGNQAPVRYSALDPAAARVALPATSHWLMLDDPEGFAAALQAFLAGVP